MARKQFDPYAALRSYSSSNSSRGSSSYGADPYSALAKYRTPEPTEEEQKAQRQKDLDKLKKDAQKKQSGTNLADIASKAWRGTKKAASVLFEGTEKVGDSIEALTGGFDRKNARIDADFKAGKITRQQAQQKRQAIIDDIKWAGTKDKGTADRLKKAGGVSLQATAELSPLQVARAAKGASLAERVAKGAVTGGVASGLHSGGEQLEQSKPSLPKTLSDIALGAGLGGVAAGVLGSRAVKQVGNAIKDKIPFVHADTGIYSKIRSMGETDASSSRKNIAADARKSLLDKNAPLQDFSKMVEDHIGRKLKTGENPYELMKLRGGVEGQAVTHLEDTAGWMKDVPQDIRTDGDVYGYAKQFLSQSDKRTPEQLQWAQKAIDHLNQKYAGDLTPLDNYTQKTRETFDSLVDLYQNEGIISKQHADTLRANPDYFAKMEVLQDETGGFLRGGSVNTKEPGALKTIKGQANDAKLAPSAEAYVKSTTNAMQDIANNRVGRALGNLADQLGENNGLIHRLRNTTDVNIRQDKYKFLSETKPGMHAVEGLLRTRSKELRRLTYELDQLNKRGLDISLKKTANDVETPILSGNREVLANPDVMKGGMRSIPTLSGTSVTRQFSRSLTTKETRDLVRSLVSEDPAELKKIRSMIESREPKMKALFDDVESLRDELDGFKTARSQAFQEARAHSDKELPKGFTRVSYMDNGVRNEIAVPKEIGDILTGADAQTLDVVTRNVGKLHNVFRQAVTTYNPLFVFMRNPVRDYKSFLTNSRNVPVHRALTDYSTALFDSLFEGKWKKDFIRAGGGQAGYFAREGGQAGKQIAKATQELTGKRTIAGRVLTSPRDFMQKMSEAIENAPRVAEYRAGIKKGLTPQEAAIHGREVTVDFAQSGSAGRVMNQWIPFLNARAQGVRRTAQAFRENPARALSVYGATTALPVAALMANNHQFPDVWSNIPDYEKENNFILILGNGKDKSGKYSQIIKMPKGDVDKILGNTFETMLDSFMNKNSDAGQQILGSVISAASNASPISFASNGKLSGSSLLSNVLPPVAKAPTEAISNYSFFKDAPIVPDNLQGAPVNEQVFKNTSGLARNIGGALGISPLKVDNTINNLAGSVPQDIEAVLSNKSPRPELNKMGQSVTSAAGGKSETEFWKVYEPAQKTKDYRQKQFYKLIDQGKYKEAQRKADEYNRDIDQRFTDYFRQHGAYMPSSLGSQDNPIDPMELIDNLKINVVISKKGKPYIKR